MDIQQLEKIASLVGEPARVKMLWSLLDGKAYTATELSHFSDTSPQSTSMHLSKLVQASLLKVSVQGRHRYYSFDREEVAYAVEALAALTNLPKNTKIENISLLPVKYCRTCYDHLAGKAGVLIHDKLVAKKYLETDNENYRLTLAGKSWFTEIGVDVEAVSAQRRIFAKPCLDWSERRYHLAGGLGASLLKTFINAGYMRRIANTRAVSITTAGKHGLYELLQLEL